MLIVQCSFDGTITMNNVGTAVREAFGPDNWLESEAEYDSGIISAEQNTIRQFGLLDATIDDIEEFVKGDVVVRFSFDEFVAHCEGVGIRLAVVSSGVHSYIDPILDMLGFDGLEVHAGRAEFTPDGLRVTYTGPDGRNLDARFKESWTRHFKAEGHTVVYIGSGLSDLDAARSADHVIARSALAEEMERLGLAFHAFDNFEEVGERVEEIRSDLAGN